MSSASSSANLDVLRLSEELDTAKERISKLETELKLTNEEVVRKKWKIDQAFRLLSEVNVSNGKLKEQKKEAVRKLQEQLDQEKKDKESMSQKFLQLRAQFQKVCAEAQNIAEGGEAALDNSSAAVVAVDDDETKLLFKTFQESIDKRFENLTQSQETTKSELRELQILVGELRLLAVQNGETKKESSTAGTEANEPSTSTAATTLMAPPKRRGRPRRAEKQEQWADGEFGNPSDPKKHKFD